MLGVVEHTLEPFVFKEARVLILGSMPSPKSREVGFYYGHPQNRFWRVLSEIFSQDVPKTVEEKKRFLLDNKIALWDVLCCCQIDGAKDSSIKDVKLNDIRSAIIGTDIVQIFTTGKVAHDLLLKHGGVESICLPSASPANCSCSIEVLIEKYKQILNYV